MANVDPGPDTGKSTLGKSPQTISAPAKAYEETAELIHAVACYFLSDAAATETLEAVAADLLADLPTSGYSRYSKLFCLRALFLRLANDVRARPQREVLAKGLTVTETFCLILRDRFELSCGEIAAAVDASEGSVRTRLERARARLFAETDPEASARPSVTPPNHICIKTKELIEDWNVASARLGQFTTPFPVSRAVTDCARCQQILRNRLASLAQFRELRLPAIPDRLRVFPISPLLVREGRKVLLNWSAAPWYLKALFEGLLATTLVLGIVLSIPRIKSIYEFWLERRLDLYSIAELAAGLGTSHSSETAPDASPGSAAAGKSGSQAGQTTAAGTSSSSTGGPTAEQVAVISESEFAGRESAIPSSDKVVRVLIKTDSPEGIKDQVMRLLENAHFSAADSDAPPGSELPGGVIFDVFIPFKSYKGLVNELKRIGEPRFITLRSKEHAVPGKAHLKIWLQRI